MDDEQQTPYRFELTISWIDFVDRETGAPLDALTSAGSWRQEITPIAPPFQGTYGECAIRANEILATLAPVPLRYVSAFGVCPVLAVRIDGI